ncbi:MAG: hypothetical protein WD772_01460 [Pseudohongiellaceae bacterium]
MKPRFFGLALVLILATIPVAAQAEHWQIARSAQQLENAADALAHNLRNLPGYGSVIHHARQISSGPTLRTRNFLAGLPI